METVNEFLDKLAGAGVKLSLDAGELSCYAPKGSLTPAIRDGIARHRTEIVSLLERRSGNIVHRSVKEFPLSAGQKGLYILQKLHPGMSAYNVPVSFRIVRGLDAALLAKAWELMLEQYPILTARVVERDGALYQRMDDACRTSIQHETISFENDEQLLALLKERAKQPFDPNQGPLTRIELFTWGGAEAILLLTVHHLVIDGVSAMIMLRSFLQTYQQLLEGKAVQPSRDVTGYEEFVAWEETMLASPEGEGHASYWRKQLDGELPILDLVPDRPGTVSATFEGRTLAERFPEELSQWVREYGKAHSLPPSVIFLALFRLVLHKYTDQEDIIVGMPVMGRAGQKFMAGVGYFINMVPLRTVYEPQLALGEYFRRVQVTMLDALFHSSYPFPLMLETLQIKEVRKNPVFQVTYAYQNFINQDTFAPLVQRQTLDIVNIPELSQEGEFDLALEVFEEGAAFSVKLKYNPELYTDQAIRRLFEGFSALLKGVSENSDRPLYAYSIISEPEKQRVLVDFNDTRAEYPQNQCLHDLFTEQVAGHSEKVAAVSGTEQLTYRQLYERSRDLALYLQAEGVKPDILVGLCMERSLDMLVGMLAILQAGGAYVPLDPNYPDERVAYTLEDSQAAVVLTQETLREKLRGLVAPGARLLSLDGQKGEIAERVAELKAKGISLDQEVKPHHLAYVIYTSGSTGKPKGVAIEHHSPVTLVHWAREVYSREELAGVLASTSVCFDLSVYEIFVTLAAGGTIILVQNALGLFDLPDRESLTLINTVPSAMEELVRLGGIPRSVLTVNLAGEALSSRLVDKIYDQSTVGKVYDLYGPSEDTTYSTYVLRTKNGPTTIGRPIANTQVYILDPQRHIQPIGVPGELYIGGDGLARGYLNRPELTKGKFVDNPFEPGSRMYRTGDRARWLPNGNIQYLGRVDTQVKIRGFRIEIGEIEVRLGEQAGIQDCAIVAQGEGAAKQLVAFYRAKETTPDHVVLLPTKELKAHLLQTLPEFMVPVAFVSLPAIPLNPNGKVDRRALMAMEATIGSGQGYVAPRNDTEERVVAMWAEVLNRAPESIGVNDNFFEMGGHSLLATQLISRFQTQMGVDLPLKTVFDQTSVARQAACIDKAEQSRMPPIVAVDRTQYERLPLSFAEERVWFMNQLLPEGASVYSVPGAFLIHGELDLDRLNDAYDLIIARHETLRTIYPLEDGQTHRVVLDHQDFKFHYTDLSQCEPDVREARAKEICLADARTAFDLTTGPLIRGIVIKLAELEHIAMVNMHHIVSDGWSIGVMIDELRTIMDAFRAGLEPELPPLRIQYADYAIWQRHWLEEGGLLEKQLVYWRQKLAGLPESLDLTTDFPRPAALGFKGATALFSMDAQLVADLKRLAERQGTTLYMVLLAAFKALLYRYTGKGDLCVGGLIANRNQAATEQLVGMFVNNLALRTQVDGDDPFAALLSKVRATCLEAYENQDAPFPRVVEAMQLRRDPSYSPLFQLLFFLQTAGMGGLDQKTQRYFLDTGIAKYEISIELVETAEGLDGSFEYNTDLFKLQTMERMIEHFTAMCRAVTANPSARVRDLDYVAEAEKKQALVEFNPARADYQNDLCLHELFVEQVADHSDDPAIVFGGERLTYQQLYDRSQELALYLQSQGVKPDTLVGLCMERSLDLVVGLLGILQAGGAYVPLDPNYPDERLAYMVRDSQAGIVLTQETLREKLGGLVSAGTRLVSLDAQAAEIAARVAELEAGGAALRQDVGPHDLAYVIYTSGSTGQPKGVAIEHHSPVTLVHWAQDVYSREELAGVLAATSVCFDLSIFEIFATLAAGGTIILVPNALALADLPNRDSVTLINTVPSAMEELVRANAIPDSVRTVNLAGEPLPATLVDRIYDTTKARKVYDLYGPSEATTYSTYVLRVKNGPQTIGRPIVNTQVYILDEQLRNQAIGVPGELYISGDGVARGYLHRPELTEEKFLANPFEPGTRMYKTGDRGRWLDDGTLQYLGRIDTQVKVRGFRIELGEIEARLNQGIGILDSAVVAQGEGADKRLIAFYRADGTTADHLVELAQEDLRAHLLRTLPDYMVPAAFVSVAMIPLSSNGKVDRRTLERTDVKFASGKEYVAPRNATEEQLVTLFAEVLKLAPENIGIYDTFFELGGNSMTAVQLISRINRRFERAIPLLAVFTTRNVAELAVVIDEAVQTDTPAIQPIDRTQFDRLPLSFAEERVWFMSQLVTDGAPLYSVPGAFVLEGATDLDQLDEALNLIIARHESLRTVFPSQDGRAEQRVLDRLDFRLERFDLSGDEPREGREEKARAICEADAATPFDLARGPLIRGLVIRLAEDEHLLMLNMHHIITDGWSLGVLLKELGEIMDALSHGRAPQLPPLPIQYVDYSVWQRKWLEESGALDQQLAYWQEKLAGLPERLDLATDYPRPNVQRFVGATQSFTLDTELTGQLKRLAEQQGATLYMTLLAAFQALLHRYTGQDDICVGSPIANRQHGETEGLIGMFVNTLALRSRVAGDDSFVELLSRVKATSLEAYQNQNVPFEKVVDMLRPQRDLAVSPLFQVMLILQNADMGAFDSFIQRYPMESGISMFDLTIAFTETAEGLAGTLEYSTALFKPRTAARLVDHFRSLCQAVAGNPSARISDLAYAGEAEQSQVLTGFNALRRDYPNNCLHELFAEQVERHSNDIAIVSGGERLTYQQLDERSHELALYLQSEGVEPDTLVGLCMDRSPDMLVGMLGILRAGGAYVPLDPNYPDERLSYMVRDSQAAIVLTQEKLREKLRGLVSDDTRLVSLDTQAAEIGERVAGLTAGGASLQQNVEPHHLAYLIYTSGSTGQPKGVAIEHHSPVTLVRWAHEVYSREELAGVLASTSICFDLSVFEIFATLAAGGTIVLVPNALELVSLAKEQSVTLINTVPSAMEELLRLGAMPDSVLTVNLAGEPLSPRLVDKIYDATAVGKVYDLYGPSEATTYSTYVLRTKNGPQTVGRPIVNTQVYILDERLRNQPIGVPGELYIAGDGVARGYLNRAELTDEKFVANPFEPGTRMYKTGDRGRWLDDGTIQYLGRIDTQVKVRGFRIELGEIEARLNQDLGILDCAVVAQGEGADKRLIAFYRAEGTTADHIVELPQEELRAHLSQVLPDYMVPAAFVSLVAIPLSSNGKVDRRTLAQMDVKMASGQEYVAPRNATEEKLVSIFAEVLKLAPENVGIHDNFFELGGHSLSAAQLISRIDKQLKRTLPLWTIFATRNVAELAVVVEKAVRSDTPAIEPIDRAQFNRLPLSFAEERIWFMSQLAAEGATIYNVPGAFVLQGATDLDQLDEALNLIIARHESLRTVFPSQDGRAEQRILDRLDFRLERIDLSGHEPREGREERARAICEADAATPFDLARGPLIRGKVIRLAEDEHLLMLNMHHIITDGWSVGVLLRELGEIMDAFSHGRPPQLPPLPIQYADYSVWQRKWLEESGALDQQLAYWQEKLAGLPERLDLATDYPRPNVQRFVGATHAFTLDAELTGQLKRLAEQQGATLFMTLLAAFQALLHRYSGQDDICVGSPIANRQHGETEGLIGMFVNTLALRSRVAGDDPFMELLSSVKATCLDAYHNQNVPFEKVVDMLRPQRDLAISPLFQVMLILQNAEIEAPDSFIQRYPLESGISQFDLTIAFTETPAGLAGSLDYSTALYKPETAARMVSHFRALCQALTAAPDTKIRDLNFIGEPERQKLLDAFNDTRADYPREACIHQLFAERVASNPDRTAVAYGGRALSYQELYEVSGDLALYLQSLGVGPDRIVGLCLERSMEMMVGIMGTAMAGGAYLPLDPVYPDERLKYMLQDSEPPVVLTLERFRDRIGALVSPDAKVLALDTQWPEIEQGVAALKACNSVLRADVRPRNLCYVIYTSGSTGKPKGVMVEHQALVNRIVWMQERYRLSPSDVVLQKTPYSFDVSVWEFFWPTMAGATVVFASPEAHKDVHYLENVINEAKITTLHFVPSMLNVFLDNARTVCPGVQQIFCSGEALDRRAVDAYRARFPNAALHNLYGPTEAAIDVTAYDCSQPGDALVPIGAPISNIQIYILDQHGNPQPIGIPGELHIAGDGLARGYLNRPELTQEKFVANPFRPGTRMYKTGDLTRWLDDGNIQYLGRIDTQVKIRGFRIELGEIEARLSQVIGILDSAVAAQGEGAGKRLIAFYRAEESTADSIVELPQEELRAHLLRTLPDYMVPSAFVSLAAIPLSSNGKVDRRALEQTDVNIASAHEYVAPRDSTEAQLVEIWAEALRLAPEKVGVYDSFFELGGHSLSAVQLISRVNRKFKRSLPLVVIFTSPNVAAFARLLSGEETSSVEILIPIQTGGDAPPVFGIPGAGATVLSLQPLSKALGAQQPFYGLQGLGLDGTTSPLTSVEQTARANVAAMKKVQPHGPYSLIGHSYGGVVAYEMARLLLEQGEEVASLTLLDSIAPWLAQEQYEAATPDEASVKFHSERLASLLNDGGHEIDPAQLAAVQEVYRASLFSYSNYKPLPLAKAIDVALYRATQESSHASDMPDDYGWNRLLQSPIRIHDVEGDHYSMLKKMQFVEAGSPRLQFVS
jgi:amino acid adenylation domain-containing protein